MGPEPRAVFDIEGEITRFDWSPDRRAVLVNTGRAESRGTYLVDLESGAVRPIQRWLQEPDFGGWLDARRVMWLSDAGELIVEHVDRRTQQVFGGEFETVQRLGRGPDGCLRVVMGRRVEALLFEVRTRVIPDP